MSVDHPPATRREALTETLFGYPIEDAYRWLEAGKDSEVEAWTEAQNAFTRANLDGIPGREALAEELRGLVATGRVGTPLIREDRLFYTRRDADQDQAALVMRERSGVGPERVLVDPGALSDRGIVTLDWFYPSADGRLLAYGLSESGNEQSTLYVMETDSGENRPDRIPRTRYASVAFEPDGSGFYYTRYPAPGEVPPGEENYGASLRYHVLGTDAAGDPVVFAPADRLASTHAILSYDGRYLVLVVTHGWVETDLYAVDRGALAGAGAKAVAEALRAGRFPVPRSLTDWMPKALFVPSLLGHHVYAQSNTHGKGRFGILRLSLEAPDSEWVWVVPEDPEATLDGFTLTRDAIVGSYLKDAVSVVRVFTHHGAPLSQVSLPGLGTVTGLGGAPTADEAYLGFESFALAPRVLRLDPKTAAWTTYLEVPSPVDPMEIVTEQRFYTSSDGTRIPLFLLRAPGTSADGERPTVVTGYGGFGISRTPVFTPSVLPWLRRGGVYAIANLRGGGEYGEDWHEAGRQGRKQSVFDDFIAAAEYLVSEHFTTPERLGIHGGSNGGLLVGAALTQRPDLYRAVWCAVPLLDMLRFDRFLIAALWKSEYGDPADPTDFVWLRAYSPYHHVVPGRRYPAVLFTTADSDSRVDPLHARKMAALLQAVAPDQEERPILLRTEHEAGHGIGRPVWKVAEELTDTWSFLARELGLSLVPEARSVR